jgi:hypothetical protein
MAPVSIELRGPLGQQVPARFELSLTNQVPLDLLILFMMDGASWPRTLVSRS